MKKPRIRIYFKGGEPDEAFEVWGVREWVWNGCDWIETTILAM